MKKSNTTTPAPAPVQENTTTPARETITGIYNRFARLVKGDADRLQTAVQDAEKALKTAQDAEKALNLDTCTGREAREASNAVLSAENALADARARLAEINKASAVPETDLLQTTVYTAQAITADYRQADLQTLANNALGFTETDVLAGKQASLGQYGYPARTFRTIKRCGGNVTHRVTDAGALEIVITVPNWNPPKQ